MYWTGASPLLDVSQWYAPTSVHNYDAGERERRDGGIAKEAGYTGKRQSCPAYCRRNEWNGALHTYMQLCNSTSQAGAAQRSGQPTYRLVTAQKRVQGRTTHRSCGCRCSVESSLSLFFSLLFSFIFGRCAFCDEWQVACTRVRPMQHAMQNKAVEPLACGHRCSYGTCRPGRIIRGKHELV